MNYTEMDIIDSVMEVDLSSWKNFHEYVVEEMLNYSHYFWRGQSDSSWGLESSLDRLLKDNGNKLMASKYAAHLNRFKMATRGRRAPNAPKDKDMSENDWWALGQHYGLATPLLDWTESPFVALYFAFEKKESPANCERAVWALGSFDEKNKELRTTSTKEAKNEKPPILEEIRPYQDENSRLVSQAGLFTRVPIGMTVESWVRKHYQGIHDSATLIKIKIPDTDRDNCLRTLNKMNISHLSLFPDLYGSGRHCNNALVINKY